MIRFTSRAVKVAASVAVLGAALALSGCSALTDVLTPSSEERDDTGTIVEGGDTDVFTLAIGDCLTDDGGDQVSEVPTVPCDQPHAYEVYAEVTMDAGAFPGDDAVTAKAEEYCTGAFAGFVGMSFDDSALYSSYYTPTEDTWTSLDDRLITCIIYDPANSAITGSLAGAAR